MNLQGDFESLFLTSILQLLSDDQKTGMLRVTSNKNECKVFFEKGTIVYAIGSQKESRLGYMLQKDGIISRDQLQKCLEAAQEQGQALGKILVSKGYISQETLKQYNTKQVEEILYNLLLWPKGRFEYKDVKLNLQGMVVTKLNPMKLILEASRRIDEMSIFTQHIPGDNVVFAISETDHNAEEIKLNANEWRILSLIDGRRSVRPIIEESGYDQFAVYKILYSLLQYGVIHILKEVNSEDNDTGDSYKAIMTLYFDILQVLIKHLAEELGKQAMSLVLECRAELPAEFQLLFKDYLPNAAPSSNIQAMLTHMRAYEDADSGRDHLTGAFNAYCAAILAKGANLLGRQPILHIVKEIEKVVEYVEKYQAGSPEKARMVLEARKLLKEMETALDHKRKR